MRPGRLNRRDLHLKPRRFVPSTDHSIIPFLAICFLLAFIPTRLLFFDPTFQLFDRIMPANTYKNVSLVCETCLRVTSSK